MTRSLTESGDFRFLEALMQRGFVTVPRILFDYQRELELDYTHVGLIYALFACLGDSGANAFGTYTLTRQEHPEQYKQLKEIVLHLQQEDITMAEKVGEEKIIFSFTPLYARLRAQWSLRRESHQSAMDLEAEDATHPAVKLAEQLLSRPVNKRETEAVLDWLEAFNNNVAMVECIILEGKNRGVTHFGYLNKIAQRLAEEGVRTPEEAAASNERYHKTVAKHQAVVQYLGFKRPLTRDEEMLLERWSQEWGFSTEVIIRACAEAVGKNNPMKYIDSVLRRWQAAGVRTVADADRLDSEHRRTANEVAAEKTQRNRRTGGKSNVILRREKKDDSYYDYLYKDFDE